MGKPTLLSAPGSVNLRWNTYRLEQLEQYRLEQHRDGQGSDQPDYCRSPIHVSDTTSEFPGFCGSYFTEVGSPSRQECRFTQCRR